VPIGFPSPETELYNEQKLKVKGEGAPFSVIVALIRKKILLLWWSTDCTFGMTIPFN